MKTNRICSNGDAGDRHHRDVFAACSPGRRCCASLPWRERSQQSFVDHGVSSHLHRRLVCDQWRAGSGVGCGFLATIDVINCSFNKNLLSMQE